MPAPAAPAVAGAVSSGVPGGLRGLMDADCPPEVQQPPQGLFAGPSIEELSSVGSKSLPATTQVVEEVPGLAKTASAGLRFMGFR